MTAENFVYWLQGFIELENPKNIPEDKIKIIKKNISLVLKGEPSLITTTVPISFYDGKNIP